MLKYWIRPWSLFSLLHRGGGLTTTASLITCPNFLFASFSLFLLFSVLLRSWWIRGLSATHTGSWKERDGPASPPHLLWVLLYPSAPVDGVLRNRLPATCRPTGKVTFALNNSHKLSHFKHWVSKGKVSSVLLCPPFPKRLPMPRKIHFLNNSSR